MKAGLKVEMCEHRSRTLLDSRLSQGLVHTSSSVARRAVRSTKVDWADVDSVDKAVDMRSEPCYDVPR